MTLTDMAIKKARYTGLPPHGQKISDGGGLHLWNSKHGKYGRLAYRYDKKQQTLQPIHQKYLGDRTTFQEFSNWLTDSSTNSNLIISNRQQQIGGVQITDYGSRISFGCKLLGYTASQGCKP